MKFKAANLGDSGFCIFRDGKVVLESRSQEYYFNAPYQLCAGPYFKGQLRNMPAESEEYEFKLQEKDFILVATDGVFDNIKVDFLAKLFDLYLDNWNSKNASSFSEFAQIVLANIVKLAYSKTCETPFSSKAKQSGYAYNGGYYC